ncbi:MAG: class I SAM-dependent methyltransferase [bacterium]|nr:class I SAM-dependent methyltransferase [bacterium]
MEKPDYKNWVPKGMLIALSTASIISILCILLLGTISTSLSGTAQAIIIALLGIVFLVCGISSVWCIIAYRAFSYNGKRKLSRQIVNGTAAYITIPEGGKGLDIGCGSGALTIACAKRNRQGTMMGVDRWGKDYASFSKGLCEHNAELEGVHNVSFARGNAIKLQFPDESFDAVTSNYVYHNITGMDKQRLLLESLRVLKKGGVFAIHDLMSPSRYGDMNSFVKALKDMGYEEVNLIDTTKNMFMTSSEARKFMLTGSSLLVGRK